MWIRDFVAETEVLVIEAKLRWKMPSLALKTNKKKFKIKLDLSRKNHINDSSAEGWAFWCFFFKSQKLFPEVFELNSNQ